ncbi:cytoplasmic tRNA 2-thiolation protein 2 [Sporobolomyces salmoneus]|uniref:cytoplasmic tRNA 2-thiolation protein 2 n=1 Tax=Sporobolomyces salmoneus TaxID=183962 RepID=UPI003177639F
MSCGQPSQDEAASENIPILPPPSSTCVRCGQPPKIVVRATAWCHDCFLASFQGRFRKSLEGAKIVSKNGFEAYKKGGEVRKGENNQNQNQKKRELSKVVLAFSGGASSRAMLELFKSSYFKQPEPEPEVEVATATVELEELERTEDQEDAPQLRKKKKGGPKKQFFPPAFHPDSTVVFIDESELPEFGPDQTSEIEQIVTSTTPFRFLPLKLSTLFSSSSSLLLSTSTSSPLLPSHSSASTSSSTERLLALLHPASAPLPPTTYSTLHQTLLQTLLLSTTRSLGAEILLMGDNSTRLGIKTISNISQGRGYSLGEEISIEYIHSQAQQVEVAQGQGQEEEEEEGRGDVLVCRPMGTSLSKEVGYYVQSEGLETVTVRNEDTSVRALDGEGFGRVEKDIKKVGIGKLVEEEADERCLWEWIDFVLNLEAQFPSTVSIITKTAHKLGLRSSDSIVLDQPGHACALCEMPAQRNAEGWNRSITISDLQSARQALAQPANPTTLEKTKGTATTKMGNVARKREPYQPSKNHLLSPEDDSSTPSSSPADPTVTATQEKEQEEGKEDVFDLSSHLCYACLLLLQTSKKSSIKKPSTTIDGKEEGRLELPSYVLENVERSRKGTTTMKEVKGEEGIKREIQEFLLEED